MIIRAFDNDKTYINVAIVDSRSQLQCVDSDDLYSKPLFYSSSMMAQHSKSGKEYTEPNVISIWDNKI